MVKLGYIYVLGGNRMGGCIKIQLSEFIKSNRLLQHDGGAETFYSF